MSWTCICQRNQWLGRMSLDEVYTPHRLQWANLIEWYAFVRSTRYAWTTALRPVLFGSFAYLWTWKGTTNHWQFSVFSLVLAAAVVLLLRSLWTFSKTRAKLKTLRAFWSRLWAWECCWWSAKAIWIAWATRRIWSDFHWDFLGFQSKRMNGFMKLRNWRVKALMFQNRYLPWMIYFESCVFCSGSRE